MFHPEARQPTTHSHKLITLGLLLALTDPALAEGPKLSARMFSPAPSPTAVGGTHSARVLDHLALYTQLSLDYANDPLAGHTADQHFLRLLQHRFTSELGLALGLWRRFELALSLPLYLYQRGDGSAGDGSGLGDLRLLPKVQLWGGPACGGWGAALVAEVNLPTGAQDTLMSDGLAVAPRAVLDYCHTAFMVSFNASYMFRSAAQIESVTVDDHLRFDLAAEAPLGRSQLSIAAELSATVIFADHEGPAAAGDQSPPLEARGYLRWRHPSGVFLSAGAGIGLTLGHGAPDARVFSGLGYLLGETKPYLHVPKRARSKIILQARAPAPRTKAHQPATRAVLAASLAAESTTSAPADSEAGQTSDDAHPKAERGVPATAYPDPPGSMDAARFDAAVALDQDTDGDGIPTPLDQCPNLVEDYDGFQDDDGCPDPDNDQDGVPDSVDECPLKPEIVNGVEDDDGCPDEGRAMVQVSGEKVKFLGEKLYFKSGSDALLPRSFNILSQVAGVLKAHWDIRKLLIEGHTDDRGDSEMNVDLSERRARRVMDYLVQEGVARHRLDAKGYGPTAPIASNRKRTGRAKNRRVEFTITGRVLMEESR